MATTCTAIPSKSNASTRTSEHGDDVQGCAQAGARARRRGGKYVVRNGGVQNSRKADRATERRRRIARGRHDVRGARRDDGGRAGDVLHHRPLFEVPVGASAVAEGTS